jgi:hypothetical protein
VDRRLQSELLGDPVAEPIEDERAQEHGEDGVAGEAREVDRPRKLARVEDALPAPGEEREGFR